MKSDARSAHSAHSITCATACSILTALTLPLMADEGNSQINYRGFVELAEELEPERQRQRISEEEFLKMAKQEGVLVLDTRSKDKFEQLHWCLPPGGAMVLLPSAVAT